MLELFFLVVLLILLKIQENFISSYIQMFFFILTKRAETALWLFFILFSPGILMHELSHWVMAQSLGLRTTGLRLGVRYQENRKGVELGSIQVINADIFRFSLVGIAPLLAGIFVIWLINQWLQLDTLLYKMYYYPQFAQKWDIFLTFAQEPLNWVLLGGIILITNTMIPSPVDLKYWYLIWLPLVLLLAGGMWIELDGFDLLALALTDLNSILTLIVGVNGCGIAVLYFIVQFVRSSSRYDYRFDNSWF